MRLGNYLSQWGSENDRLAEQLMSQAQQWESVQELRRENERLRRMLGFSSSDNAVVWRDEADVSGEAEVARRA